MTGGMSALDHAIRHYLGEAGVTLPADPGEYDIQQRNAWEWFAHGGSLHEFAEVHTLTRQALTSPLLPLLARRVTEGKYPSAA